MAQSRQIVLTFNQLTETFLKDTESKGWTNPDGTPTGVVEFRVSASPFNTQYAENSPVVRAFLNAVRAVNHAYNFPPYGDALPVLVDHPLNKNSVIPYHIAVDQFIVEKMPGAWERVAVWLNSEITAKFPDAPIIAERGSAFLEFALAYVKAHPDITPAEWNSEVLVPHLGADWRAKSENLNNKKYLRLWGASDELLAVYKETKIVKTKTEGGVVTQETVELPHEARWVPNFINLFKPTTAFKVGAVSDIINFAAMVGDKPIPSHGLTDQDSVRVLTSFDEKSPILYEITGAYFDMEPDDTAVHSFLDVHSPNVVVTRVYPNQKIADAAEAFLKDKLSLRNVLVDPLLRNAKALTDVYIGK